MRREDLADLTVFLAVAEERSFTRAAARVGLSQSALSHTVRRLEERLGLRLLTRTTRSVAPTEAGERLLESLRPAFADIDHKLAALTELREKPAGTVRINASLHAAEAALWPRLEPLLRAYPDVRVEIAVDIGLSDIAAEGFDAGVRLGEHLARDMIAVPIGPEQRLAIVGAPSYFERVPPPDTPHELTEHSCINLRLPTRGGVYVWEFEKEGHELRVRVDGQLVFNDGRLILTAALAGLGLACVLEDEVEAPVREGRLVRVLEDWSAPFAGYHLYYPSRRQQSPAFALIVDALRWKGSPLPKSGPSERPL